MRENDNYIVFYLDRMEGLAALGHQFIRAQTHRRRPDLKEFVFKYDDTIEYDDKMLFRGGDNEVCQRLNAIKNGLKKKNQDLDF